MKILLSNDDGYQAPGILALFEALKQDHEVMMVAPDRNRSAASNSLTLDVPLRPHRLAADVICVENGTPTDCVHIALTGLLEDFEPDMVVSGVNSGANMGDDTLYSGTVAAAMEGRHLGKPSMAVSLVGSVHYQAAAQVACQLIRQLEDQPFLGASILNLNVPDLPFEQIQGVRVCRLGRRHMAESVVKTTDPRNKTIYWIGAAGEAADSSEGTDFHAILQGFASLTPLQVDLTKHTALQDLSRWVDEGSAFGA